MSPRQRDRVRSLVTEAAEPIDAPTISELLNLHVTTVRFHLKNLVDEGAIVAVPLPPNGVGRPRLGYRVVMAPPIDELLVMMIAQAADTPEGREELAARAGSAWAAKHLPAPGPVPTTPTGLPDPVVLAETVLTRLGFKVTGVVSAFGDHEITLCGCPLQSLEKELPEVARGLVRGILTEALAAGSPALASSYAVGVRPDGQAGACELRLRLARTSTPEGAR